MTDLADDQGRAAMVPGKKVSAPPTIVSRPSCCRIVFLQWSPEVAGRASFGDRLRMSKWFRLLMARLMIPGSVRPTFSQLLPPCRYSGRGGFILLLISSVRRLSQTAHTTALAVAGVTHSAR